MQKGEKSGDQHGMRVTLTFNMTLDQAIKLKQLAVRHNTTVQQIIRDYIERAALTDVVEEKP